MTGTALLATACGPKSCGGVVPLTTAQRETVKHQVEACTTASGRVAPYLKAADHLAAAQAAVDARNICSSARARITETVGEGSPVDACREAAALQQLTQERELAFLDGPTDEAQAAVLEALGRAIGQQRACGAALDRLN